MKKLFGLLALVLAVVSCQNDFDGTNLRGDEVAVTLNVAVPDDATRAAGSDSAKSGLQNVDLNRYDIRYILEVYDAKDNLAKPRIVKCEDKSASTSFDLRLVPGRDYRFVVWADFVPQGTKTDYHYNTTNIQAISLNGDQKANDESRDAYTCVRLVEKFQSGAPIEIELKRPFAKLRVVTTDMNHLYSDLTSVTVDYTTPIYTTFNALEGEKTGVPQDVATKRVDLTADFKYTNESNYRDNGKMTLFADYLFGTEDDAIHFTLDAADATGMDIPEVVFNTNIPVQRNYLTTVMGPVLTDAANVTVSIDGAFENDGHFEDAPYYQVAVSNGFELVKALYEGREIIVLNDITVTAADVEAYKATTRADAAINPVLNLNGFTITIENNGTEALVNLNGGALIVEGEGAIKSDNGALVETIYNAGEATIEEKAATEPVVNCLSEIREAFANGGEYNMVCDVVYPETLVLEAGKSLVLNLNGKTISQSKECIGNYNMVYNKGELTINGDGAISFKDTGAGDPNFGWGSYTLRNEGTLVVNGATIEHLGEQNPGNGQPNVHMYCAIFQYSGKSTINSGVISTPTYRSARLWNGEMTINGGQFVGQLWLQAVSDNANLVINGGEFVARGNDGSSVFVSNSGKAVKCSINGGFFYNKVGMSEPIACIAGGKFTPAAKEATSEELLAEGYEFVEENGVWVVNYVTTTTAELKAALAEGKDVVLANDLTDVAVDTTAPYGNYYGIAHNGGVFNGGGYTLDFDRGTKNSNGKYDNYGIMTSGGTIKNVAISGVFRGIMIMYPTQDIYVDNVTLNDPDDYGVCYTINTGEGDGTHNLYVSNTTLNGWTSIGTAVKETYFTSCTFGQGLYYTDVYGRLVKPYVDTVFENCEFSSMYYIDLSSFVGTKVTLKNCTVNGVKITAENWTSLVAPEDACGEGQISVELKNGTYLTANNVADYIIFE